MRVLRIPDDGPGGGGGPSAPSPTPNINPTALAAILAALDGGGAGPVVPVTAGQTAAQQSAPTPAEPVVPDGMRLVPAQDFAKILERLDTLTQTQVEREAAQRAAEQARLARTAEGDPAKAYKELQTQYQTAEQRWQSELENERSINNTTHKGLAISQALAGRSDLVDGAASHLQALLASDPQLEVVRENGHVQVRTRTLQSVAAYLADLLKQPQNRLFLKATATGGSGATQHQAAAGGQWGNDQGEQPPNLGFAVAKQWEEREAKTDKRFDPTVNRLGRAGRG